MIRTVISLDPEEKAWLDDRARHTGKSMTAVVREALAQYRIRETSRDKPSLAALIEQTRGIWAQGDGLAWQEKLRAEWDSR